MSSLRVSNARGIAATGAKDPAAAEANGCAISQEVGPNALRVDGLAGSEAQSRATAVPAWSAQIEIHPRLVEDSVSMALRGSRLEREYHRERDAIYLFVDPEERERAFGALHAGWFERLGLGRPLRAGVAEQAAAIASVGRFVVGPAASPRDEGADLYIAASERIVVIALQARTLIDRVRVLTLLRREILHVADMLDVSFEYERTLPRQTAGPTADRLAQDRYRAAWSASVDGRLVAAGRLPGAAARAERFAEFGRAFGCLGEDAEWCFESIFLGPRPTHLRLAAIAMDPREAFGLPGRAAGGGSRCSLCGFPAYALERDPRTLPEPVVSAILSDFPDWEPARGLCLQCADLYRARAAARGALVVR